MTARRAGFIAGDRVEGGIENRTPSDVVAAECRTGVETIRPRAGGPA